MNDAVAKNAITPATAPPAQTSAPIPSPNFQGSVVHLLLGTEGGGIITAVSQWARLLAAAGWTMHFASLSRSTATDMLNAAGYETRVLSVSRIGRMTRLWRSLAPLRPRILHCHNPASHLMAWRAAGRLGARVVRTVHADMFEEMRGSLPAWRIAAWRLAMAWALPRSARVVIVSPHLANLLPGMREGRPGLVTLPNGYDPGAIDSDASDLPAALREWLGEAPMVLAMGRLVPVKNFPMLLRAWRQVVAVHPDARLVIAGSGPREAELRELARDLAIEDRVRFVGWITGVAPYLRRCRAVAISSTSECCPMLVFEAMAARRAIVATRVGGIPFLVEDGREGLLVADNDAEALAAAIDRVIADPQCALRLGKNGRTSLESQFTHHAVAQHMADVYRDAAAGAIRSVAMTEDGVGSQTLN